MTATDDPLGTRMKEDYEHRTRFYLPRRTYTLIRVDGRAFHTFCRNFERPFDHTLMAAMDAAAAAICDGISGTRCAFVQSDEITVLITDFESAQTEAPFDGNLQKLCSLSASLATAYFNRAMDTTLLQANPTLPILSKPAQFDSRVWTVPQRIEVYNSFLWRQNDATRNAISMTAQAHFPHAQLQGKSSDALQEMLWQEKGINFNDLPAGFKRGRFVERVVHVSDVAYVDKRTGESHIKEGVTRSSWEITEPPIFSTPEGREWLLSRIPVNG